MTAEAERRRSEIQEDAERLDVEQQRWAEEQASDARSQVTAVPDDAPIDSSPAEVPDERTEGNVEETFDDGDIVDGPTVPERHEQSRYERHSAKLPRIGDDAANVVRSLESFRKTLRGS